MKWESKIFLGHRYFFEMVDCNKLDRKEMQVLYLKGRKNESHFAFAL